MRVNPSFPAPSTHQPTRYGWFFVGGDIRLAVITKQNQHSFTVLIAEIGTQRCHEQQCHEKQFLYEWSVVIPWLHRVHSLHRLEKRLKTYTTALIASRLSGLHQLLLDDPEVDAARSHSSHFLCDYWHKQRSQHQNKNNNKNASVCWQHACIVLALLEGKPWVLRQNNHQLAINSLLGIAAWQQAQQAQANQKQQLETYCQWAQQLDALEASTQPTKTNWRDGTRAAFIDSLHALLIKGKRAPEWSWLSEALGLSQQTEIAVQLRLKGWLTKAGAWHGWPYIWLAQAEIPPAFTEAAHQHAAQCNPQLPDSKGRTNLCALPTFTFDPAGTADFDDAISVEASNANQLRVFVHIAQPASIVMQNPLLREAAEQRLNTLYLPTQIQSMLPLAIEHRFSLVEKKRREAMTWAFTLEDNQATLLDVFPSVVEVNKNLTHAQGAYLLNEPSSLWKRLSKWAEHDNQLRKSETFYGGFDAVELQLDQHDTVVLLENQRDLPLRIMVEALAIACNAAFGAYCTSHAIPALYRVQPAHTDINRFPSAYYSTQGAPHTVLGCNRYIHGTSPLRRFPDLLMQHQLTAHLSGNSLPLTKPTLDNWGKRAQERIVQHQQLQRQVLAYYKALYTQQNPTEVYTAKLPDWQMGKKLPWQLWVKKLGTWVWCDVPLALSLSNHYQVRVVKTEEEMGKIWIRPVSSR